MRSGRLSLRNGALGKGLHHISFVFLTKITLTILDIQIIGKAPLAREGNFGRGTCGTTPIIDLLSPACATIYSSLGGRSINSRMASRGDACPSSRRCTCSVMGISTPCRRAKATAA